MKLEEAVMLTNEELTTPRFLKLANKAIEKTGRWAPVDKIYKRVLDDLKHPENITNNPEAIQQLKAAIRHAKHETKRSR